MTIAALAQRNPYLASLMDPENNFNARIPDLTCVPTSVIQCEYEDTITTNGSGMAGLILYPTMGSQAFVQIASGSTPGAITYGTPYGWSNSNQYQAVFAEVRPVSGVIYVDYIGTSQADQGLITAMWGPRTISKPSSVSDAANRNYGETAPAKLGCKILWRPSDNQDCEFFQVASNKSLPYIGFIASGMTANLAVLRVRCYVNYECIPFSDTFDLVSPAPSPIDRNALEQAFRWGQQTVDKISTLLPYASNVATVGMNALSWYRSNMSQGRYGNPRITSIE